MPKGTCSIARIGGLKKSTRRAVVFLVRNGELNGSAQEFVGRAGIAELGLNSQFADG
jgi:hypothetical protein